MLLDLAVPCTQAVFGGLVGLPQSAISTLCTSGVLREGASCAEWLADYAKHLRDLAHGRGGAAAETRRRLYAAQAVRVELDNRKLAGELCATADVERETFRTYRMLRDRISGVADRTAPIVAAESDVTKCHEIIAGEIRAALREVVQALAVADA